jgi:hypothetical protein
MNLGWMDEICPDFDDNPRLAKPFNCKVGDSRWRVATDGHLMVAVEIGDLPFPDGVESPPDAAPFFSGAFHRQLIWQGDLTDLKRRVGFERENDGYSVRRGRVGGAIFNLRLIGRALAPLDSTGPVAAFIGGPANANREWADFFLEVRGEHVRPWRAFIMGMRPLSDGEPKLAELLLK